ncbi:MAG TPA: SGNH/GDSL hydrolase family protein [Candidatus Binatia bacterium]|nr:SGNH/GDSL hydrolase family protein [Candidatus Binatia bacterium]
MATEAGGVLGSAVVRRRLLGLVLGAVAAAVALALAELALRAIGLGDPILYENRASYGYRPLPDQSRRRLFGARVHVNSLGLRGPEPPAGALRLLFLGDSVTWGGSAVDDRELFAAVAADTVAARLGDRAPAVAPLDAGVNGWGPQNVLALLEEHGGFGSAVWVLTLIEDDFRRDKTRTGEVPYFNVAPTTALEELAVLAAYKVVTAYKRPKPDADLERIASDNLAACARIFALARDADARLLVVWHPTAPALAGTERQPNRARLATVADAAGVPLLDLGAVYSTAGEGLYADGLHLSVAGHRVAGRAIGERLAALLAETAAPPDR